MSQQPKVTIILNVRINSRHRLERLTKLINKMICLPECSLSIRIRGALALETQIMLNKIFQANDFNEFKIYIGDNFRQWKMNTLVQVNDSPSSQYLLLQEDHFPILSMDNLNIFIKECISEKVDVGIVTAWHTYREFREKVAELPNSKIGAEGIFYELTQSPWKILKIDKPRYLVPLVGYFKKEFLVKVLLTPRPYLRRYPALSPFDFEQGPNAKWVLPFKIGFTKEEIFACIDDDIDIPGTSLQSRGLYELDQIRKNEHHTYVAINSQNVIAKLKRNLPIGKYRNGIYSNLGSSRSKLIWVFISNKIMTTLKFIDSCIYSSHAILNYIFNISERYYRKKTKIN